MTQRYQSTFFRSIFPLAAGLLVGFLPHVSRAEIVEPPEGFRALFNGENLDGWYGLGHFDPRKLWAMTDEERAAKREADMVAFQEHWTIENGELVNDGEGPYATTDEEFGDIELLLEYKTVPLADSGVYLRGNPQVQIWDYTEEGGKWKHDADKGSGGLWNNTKGTPGRDPLVLADKPFGEWNSMRIIQVGDKTTVYLNDQLVVDHATMENFWDRSSPLWPKGPIQLQTHGGEIRWRNIFIREIPPAEANEILRRRGATGFFKSIFNGKDFEGWAGPIENYEIIDGAIVCRPGKGGHIYTEEVYDDFIVQLEFKLPPAGNNGLAIRYPGSGNSSQVGMTEIQILDDTAERYANLDPRQYNGSAYGMVAATRGFLRPVGEWNFKQVTVKGTTLKIELNGTTILDADLAEVEEFMNDQPHPGRLRTSGHFGFAGHNDPVAFRNIQIQKLSD